MHTDGQTATYGRRETTLIGYPPAPTASPPADTDVAPTTPIAMAPSERQRQVVDVGGEPPSLPANERGTDQAADSPAQNLAANLATNLAGALDEPGSPDARPATNSARLQPASEVDALARPVALDEVQPPPAGDRRNPRSRRLPINRGRHLSRAFFEEGERQELIGWEHSPLVADANLSESGRPGFTSFDRVPRKRAPILALAVIGGIAVAAATASVAGLWSSRDPAPRGVWTALQVPGAGWQPPMPVKTATAMPVAPTAAAKVAVAPAATPTTRPPTPATTPKLGQHAAATAFAPTADAPPAARPIASAAPPMPVPSAVKASPAPSFPSSPVALPTMKVRPPATTPASSPAATKSGAPAMAVLAPARPRAQVPRVVSPPPAASRRHPVPARRPAGRSVPARAISPVRARVKSPPAPPVETTATEAPAPAASASAEEAGPPAAAAALPTPVAPAAPATPAATAAPAAPAAPVELPPASTAPAAEPVPDAP